MVAVTYPSYTLHDCHVLKFLYRDRRRPAYNHVMFATWYHSSQIRVRPLDQNDYWTREMRWERVCGTAG